MPATPLPTHLWTSDEPLPLECGATLPSFDIAYETWGTPGDRGGTAVVLHALSGSSHCFASDLDPEPGWWQGLARDDSPLRPTVGFTVCTNLLGGCYGSTGPQSIDPTSGRRYGIDFPPLSLGDIVEAHRRVLRGIGAPRPYVLVGGSMGGMLALDWAVRHPDEVGAVISIGAPAKSYPQMIALRSVQREAILSDPAWNDGKYTSESFPDRGLALARKIGMITYRSDEEFTRRFGRDERDARPHFLDGLYEVQSYLNHQGRKFVDRFDPNTYLYFSRAMDRFDVADGYASLDDAAARVSAKCLLLSIDSDFLCPPYQVREMHDAIVASGGTSWLHEVHSIHGHDGFLIEMDQIIAALREHADALGLAHRE